MSTIVATLEPDVDGTLHLPLPPELRHGKLKVTATVETVSPTSKAKAGCLKGIWMAPDFDEPLEDFKEYMEGGFC